MKIGISLPHAGDAASRDAIATAATRAEEIGLDSVWVVDRLLRPMRPIPFRGRPPADQEGRPVPESIQRLRHASGWQYRELATGHWPMISAAQELADLLQQCARG